MVTYTTTILKFTAKGEKSGWTYIEVPADIAEQLSPGNKKSFRVKGKLDNYTIKQTSLLPMGGGSFIIPLKADIRKAIAKNHGAMLKVQLAFDEKEYQLDKDFIACLEDDPDAYAFFKSLPRGFQNYYSKWIETAKTEPTKTKRIALAVSSLAKKMDFGEMLRSQKKDKLL